MATKIPTLLILVPFMFILFFTFLAFQESLATIFGLITLGILIMYLANHSGISPFKKGPNLNDLETHVNRTRTLKILLIGYPAFIILSLIVINVISSLNIIQDPGLQSITSPQSVFDILAQSQLVFEDNIWFSIFIFSVVVGTIETMMIAGALEFLKDVFKVPIAFSVGMIIIMLVISLGFMFYHLGAKGIDNYPALIMTFVFAFISCIMIVYERQSLSAVLMHVINNLIAILISFSLITTILPIIAIFIGSVFIIHYLLKRFNITFTGG